MKKFITIIIIFIAILCMIIYGYLQYRVKFQNIKTQNVYFETYLNKEVSCFELTSIINKAIDRNYQNNVKKDEKGFYKQNDTDSIAIQVKMTDNDKTYDMESFYNGGMENFIQYYRLINFKCTKIKYHEKTKLISYMYFEQIA